MTKHKVGDVCPACGGKGEYLMHADAHRSEGWVPCNFFTAALKKLPRIKKKVKCVDLRCSKGKLV